MARIQDRVVPIRLPREAVEVLADFASQHGMMNKSGDPNISEAARVLLDIGLRNSGKEGLIDVYKANARAEWIQRVSGAWQEAMRAVIQIGMSD